MTLALSYRRMLACIVLIPLAGLCRLTATAQATDYAAPTSIPKECSADATIPLQRFLNSVPDGNSAVLSAGGCYRVDGTLELRDRVGLTLNGNGATLRAGTAGAATRAHLRVTGGTGLAAHDLRIDGANPYGPVHTYQMQWQHGIDLRGPQGMLINRVQVEDVYGDSFYLGRDDRNGRNTRNVRIVDSSGRRAGRVAGAAFVAVQNATVLRGFYELAGLNLMDVEPNGGNLVDWVTIDGIRVGAWPTRQWQFTATGPPSGTSATVRNLTIRNAVFERSPMTVRMDLAGDRLPVQGVRVENNRSLVTYAGPVAPIVFNNTIQATVSGNSVPVSGGQYGIAACNVSGLTYSGNQFPGSVAQVVSRIALRC
jgi:hypothetical protein